MAEAKKISKTITVLESNASFKPKTEPIKTTVESERSKTVAKLDAEQSHITALTNALTNKNAEFALASDDRAQALLADDVATLRIRARNLSRNLRSVAQDFKAFAQQQEAILNEIAKSSQPKPSK